MRRGCCWIVVVAVVSTFHGSGIFIRLSHILSEEKSMMSFRRFAGRFFVVLLSVFFCLSGHARRRRFYESLWLESGGKLAVDFVPLKILSHPLTIPIVTGHAA